MQTRKELMSILEKFEEKMKLEKAEINRCMLLGFLLLVILWFIVLVIHFAVMGSNFILIAICAFVSPMMGCLPFELKRRKLQKLKKESCI